MVQQCVAIGLCCSNFAILVDETTEFVCDVLLLVDGLHSNLHGREHDHEFEFCSRSYTVRTVFPRTALRRSITVPSSAHRPAAKSQIGKAEHTWELM